MSKLRVHSFNISYDGFSAGPDQDRQSILDYDIAPALLGSGERLFDDLDLLALGYELKNHFSTAAVTHVKIGKKETN